jgi:hypothetical protein
MRLIVKLEDLKVDAPYKPHNIIEIPFPDVVMTGEHYCLFIQGLTSYLMRSYGEYFYKPAFGDNPLTESIQRREEEV